MTAAAPLPFDPGLSSPARLRSPDTADIVVRTGPSTAAIAPVMKRAVAEADPTQAVSDLPSLEALISDSLADDG